VAQDRYNVAVVGAGLVGEEMVKVLIERDFPARRLDVMARHPREIEIAGRTFQVRKASVDRFDGTQIALFAGTENASEEFAWPAVENGCVVIDNTATFRLDDRVPLVVPEVNPDDLAWHKGLIANPNCSTIQMVVALYPLHRRFGLRKVVVATYQSVSGTGRDALEELSSEMRLLAHGREPTDFGIYPAQIADNLIPQVGGFGEDRYTSEESKMILETQKIFSDPTIEVVPTCVRVPITLSHSEVVWASFSNEIAADDAREILRRAPGVQIVDDWDDGTLAYPTPLEAAELDPVFVGRIRQDPFSSKAITMWIVADNLRKGAALNAVQIAELLVERNLLQPSQQT
jgi:aspartate-semialdehyde dehydrogenase